MDFTVDAEAGTLLGPLTGLWVSQVAACCGAAAASKPAV